MMVRADISKQRIFFHPFGILIILRIMGYIMHFQAHPWQHRMSVAWQH
jgi:hypothetical protein